jgi:hypothetical protein
MTISTEYANFWNKSGSISKNAYQQILSEIKIIQTLDRIAFQEMDAIIQINKKTLIVTWRSKMNTDFINGVLLALINGAICISLPIFLSWTMGKKATGT